MSSEAYPERRIEELSARLRQLQDAYYLEGRSPVTDLEYDRLHDELVRLEKAHPELAAPDSPTLRVGSDLSSELPEVMHTIPVLSLDKAYTGAGVIDWMQRSAMRLGGEPLSFTAEEKIDGVSIVLYYEDGILGRAVTRGNGYAGNDVTGNIRTIGSVPLRLTRPVSIAVRGEVYLPKSAFSRLNAAMEIPYANPRNLAAGTVRRKKSRETAAVPLDIFIYEGFYADLAQQPESHAAMTLQLKELGFRINPRFGVFTASGSWPGDLPGSWRVGSYADLELFIATAAAERTSLDHEIDGLVVKVNELPAREQLGYTGHHPRWAIAYKFDAPEGVTEVIGIDVQVGRTGRITPVARVNPVRIGGSVVSNVTLHNQDYIDMLELAIGDTVAVSKRGDVIPAVERVLEKNEAGNAVWRMPESCLSCGSELERIGAHTFCRNPDCPDQRTGRIQFFAGKGQMDIASLGPETISWLIDAGLLRDIPDLYRIDYRALAGNPGFGERKAELLQQGVDASRTQPYPVVLASLGIPDLGKKAVELLIGEGIDSIDELLAIADARDLSRLVAIKGFGQKIAESLIRELGRPQVRDLLSRLQEAGLQFRHQRSDSESEDQRFAGQVWCVTGSFARYNPRDRAMEEVVRRGGRTVSGVTGRTTHLLAGSGAGSKLAKARELGVQIVTEEEFIELLR